MAEFNLQFLNGVGESYDQPRIPYNDMENKQPMQRGDYRSSANDEVELEEMEVEEIDAPSCYRRERRVNIWFWMAVGAVAGQVIKKLFKD